MFFSDNDGKRSLSSVLLNLITKGIYHIDLWQLITNLIALKTDFT